MATYKNPAALAGKAIPTEAGQVKINRDVFDFANPATRPATFVTNDLLLIGIVPAGCKLVPHLTRISMPALDSNGAPTGDYEIGTATDSDALKATAPSETAVVLSGEDFVLATADIGAKFVDVPIYAKALANSATVPVTGKVIADLVIRPYDSAVDTDVT